MACADFPNSPSVNDTFTIGNKTWKWNGTVWVLVGGVVTGAQGVQGLQGFQGMQGPQGLGLSFSGEDTRVVYVASNAPATDANFTFDSTNKSLSVTGTVSTPAGLFKMSSSSASSIRIPLRVHHNTSATPTAGLSVGIDFLLDDSTTDDIVANRLTSEWIDATHATYHSKFIISGAYNGSGSLNRVAELWGNQQIKTPGIHNNPTTNASTGSTQDISSGEYDPNVAAVGGWAPSAIVDLCAQWLRVGNVVNVSGSYTVQPAGAGVGSVSVVLPIATASSSACQVSGTAVAEDASTNVFISGTVTNGATGGVQEARIRMRFATTNVHTVTFIFTYVVS